MLLPRFSLRFLLGGTAVCGGFFVVLAAAARGQVWASAITISVGSILLAFLLYAMFFAAAMLIASIGMLPRRQPAVRSPFAQHVAAPQLVPQDDEE